MDDNGFKPKAQMILRNIGVLSVFLSLLGLSGCIYKDVWRYDYVCENELKISFASFSMLGNDSSDGFFVLYGNKEYPAIFVSRDDERRRVQYDFFIDGEKYITETITNLHRSFSVLKVYHQDKLIHTCDLQDWFVS